MRPSNISIPSMSVKRLKQELVRHGLPVDGCKPTLVVRLQHAMRLSSNEAFRTYTEQKSDAAAGVARAQKEVTEIETQMARLQAQLAAAQLATAKEKIVNQQRQQTEAQQQLNTLEPRLYFSRQLPGCVLLSILGQLGKRAGQRAACVCQEWQGSVAAAKALGMYDLTVISVAAGERSLQCAPLPGMSLLSADVATMATTTTARSRMM